MLAVVAGYFLYPRTGPCDTPLTYRIGTFDNSFNISRSDFLAAAQEAAAIWGKPVGRVLFAYSANGDLPINLIYDARQQTTVQNQVLNANIAQNSSVADSVKQQYSALEAQYASDQAAYAALLSTYNQNLDSYNAAVEYWNGRGGAPASEFATLSAQKNSLELERNNLNQASDNLNAEAAQINALIDKYNLIADHINTTVGVVNSTAGKEFNEGQYISDSAGARINIYEYSSKVKLVRVLAHEFGHALGLEHNNNPDSIMYALNQSSKETLSPDDLKELKARCGLK